MVDGGWIPQVSSIWGAQRRLIHISCWCRFTVCSRHLAQENEAPGQIVWGQPHRPWHPAWPHKNSWGVLSPRGGTEGWERANRIEVACAWDKDDTQCLLLGWWISGEGTRRKWPGPEGANCISEETMKVEAGSGPDNNSLNSPGWHRACQPLSALLTPLCRQGEKGKNGMYLAKYTEF